MNWDISKSDMDLIIRIAARAKEGLTALDKHELVMDLNACHSNGCALDLQKLLEAPALDFFHDVLGIRQNINRRTGKLERNFDPRCAKPGEDTWTCLTCFEPFESEIYPITRNPKTGEPTCQRCLDEEREPH